jgi:hypothetical protein
MDYRSERTMRRRYSDRGLNRQFVTAVEARITLQGELIGRLKRNGRSAEQAEALLHTMQVALFELRSHEVLMEKLVERSAANIKV